MQKDKICIAVSGFTPYRSGTSVNASFTLATKLCNKLANEENIEVKLVEVPVVWGEPAKHIQANDANIDFWIAFGEGTSEMRIERRGTNVKGGMKDNKGVSKVSSDALHEIHSKLNVQLLHERMENNGLQVKISTDAGKYLCEEICYELLQNQEKYKSVFIHVPGTGWDIIVDNIIQKFDEDIIDIVATRLCAVFKNTLSTLLE